MTTIKQFNTIPLDKPTTPLLDKVNVPSDMRSFSNSELLQLANELREYLLYTVGLTGGHFGAGLGVVELTIALHYVYNTPKDKLVWDVGHQCYPHKILTGRKHQFTTLRQRGGLAGFPKRSESEYDTFGVGHSSTSISAALGMAVGSELKNQSNSQVAIIGDGAMSAGMAFEALNHAAARKTPLLVILNDNQMSISKNVGAMSNYLNRIWASGFYNNIREGGKKALTKISSAARFVSKIEEYWKGLTSSPGIIFEEMGYNYIGPIDGHDLLFVIKILQQLKTLKEPVFLHCITEKGHGFKPAMDSPIKFHALSKISKNANSQTEVVAPKPKFQDVFGAWLCAAAANNPKIVAVTPAMTEGSGMVEFAQKFPNQFDDVAIAEQHAVTYCAGLACEGLQPILAIYSTFLQRGYDQLIHDVAIQNLNVLFAMDRAGVVGEDGPTHAGSFDLSYLRCIPNLVVMAPSDEQEMCHLLQTGLQYQGPALVRYPRGSGVAEAFDVDAKAVPVGKAKVVRTSQSKHHKIAILGFGTVFYNCLQAAEQYDCTLIDMRFIKPLDTQLLDTLAEDHSYLLTVEDNVVAAGAGSAVAEYCNATLKKIAITHLGLPDFFQDQGTRAELLAEAGLDPQSIAAKVKAINNHINA